MEIKAALLLDYHSLSINQLVGLLIIFKVLLKQDWTEGLPQIWQKVVHMGGQLY
jgi:hypothetical protein